MSTNPTTLESSPSQKAVAKIQGEFSALLSRQEALEKEKQVLIEKLNKSEAERNALNPQHLAKFYAAGKEFSKKELELDSQRQKLKDAAFAAKAAYEKAQADFQACENAIRNLSSDSASAAAMLFAKVDAYCADLKRKIEADKEQTRIEKGRAETQRQATDDLIKKAQSQLDKIEGNGKVALERVRKAEEAMALKIKEGEEYLKKQALEKEKLEKEVRYLAELRKKHQDLEAK